MHYLTMYTQTNSRIYRVGMAPLMVSVLAFHAVGFRFESWSSHTKDHHKVVQSALAPRR